MTQYLCFLSHYDIPSNISVRQRTTVMEKDLERQKIIHELISGKDLFERSVSILFAAPDNNILYICPFSSGARKIVNHIMESFIDKLSFPDIIALNEIKYILGRHFTFGADIFTKEKKIKTQKSSIRDLFNLGKDRKEEDYTELLKFVKEHYYIPMEITEDTVDDRNPLRFIILRKAKIQKFLLENGFNLFSGYKQNFSLNEEIENLKEQQITKITELEGDAFRKWMEEYMDYKILPFISFVTGDIAKVFWTELVEENGYIMPTLKKKKFLSFLEMFKGIYYTTNEKTGLGVLISSYMKDWKHSQYSETEYIPFSKNSPHTSAKGVLNLFIKNKYEPKKRPDFIKIYSFLFDDLFNKIVMSHIAMEHRIKAYYIQEKELCDRFVNFCIKKKIVSLSDMLMGKEYVNGGEVNFIKICVNVNFLMRHIYDVLCSGHLDRFVYLIHFYLYILIKPLQIPRVAIIMASEQGAGKTIIHFGFAKNLLATNSFILTSQGENSMQKFTSVFENKSFIVLEEMFENSLAKSQINANLKSWISDPTITIEEKNINQKTDVRNISHVIIDTNKESLYVMTNDVRRYCVYTPNNPNKYLYEKTEYFDSIANSCKYFPIIFDLFMNGKFYSDSFDFERHPWSCISELDQHIYQVEKDPVADLFYSIIKNLDVSPVIKKGTLSHFELSELYDKFSEGMRVDAFAKPHLHRDGTEDQYFWYHLLPGMNKEDIKEEFAIDDRGKDHYYKYFKFISILALDDVLQLLSKFYTDIEKLEMDILRFGKLPNGKNIFSLHSKVYESKLTTRFVIFDYAVLYIVLNVMKKRKLPGLDTIYECYKEGFNHRALYEWYKHFQYIFKKDNEDTNKNILLKYFDFIRKNHSTESYKFNGLFNPRKVCSEMNFSLMNDALIKHLPGIPDALTFGIRLNDSEDPNSDITFKCTLDEEKRTIIFIFDNQLQEEIKSVLYSRFIIRQLGGCPEGTLEIDLDQEINNSVIRINELSISLTQLNLIECTQKIYHEMNELNQKAKKDIDKQDLKEEVYRMVENYVEHSFQANIIAKGKNEKEEEIYFLYKPKGLFKFPLPIEHEDSVEEDFIVRQLSDSIVQLSLEGDLDTESLAQFVENEVRHSPGIRRKRSTSPEKTNKKTRPLL